MYDREHSMSRDCILQPIEGYDLAAPWYDNWHWTEFWKRNEVPMVGALLDSLVIGHALDVGSGTGTYRFQFEKRGCDTVAIDISSKMLEIQVRKERSIGGQLRGTLVNGDVRAMPKEWTGAFDCMVCARVISHLEEYGLAIREMSRVLRKGGRLIVTDVSPEHPYSHVKISNGSIHSIIRAFKHDLGEMADTFQASGLKILTFKQFGLRDLNWLPPRNKFAKIYLKPDTPIFFLFDVKKACDP